MSLRNSTALVVLAAASATSLLIAQDAPAQESNPVPATRHMDCAELLRVTPASAMIESAVEQPAGPVPSGRGELNAAAPAHCLVRGIIDRRTGVAGKPYGIRFEMRLPDTWNGRFLFQGGGGTNGEVRPALGVVKGPPALAAGFAVISQDAGHEGADASFGEDQQARIDMAYRSYDRVTTLGKALVLAYYGRRPDHSYFMGCSEGGREALLVSQRMPTEYDGVVAGDPGFMLGVNLDDEWDSRAIRLISPLGANGKPDLARAFSNADLALVANRIVEQCDGLDGLKDQLIENWRACQVDLSKLGCKGPKASTCLTLGQVRALSAIYAGGKDSHGKVIADGFPYDSGVGQPGFRVWKLGNSPVSRGVNPMQGLFMTPYDPSYQDRGKGNDFDRQEAGMVETGSLYRADGVSYSTFRQRGAKLLIYTGASDPIFSPKTLIAYYQRLAAANGGPEATSAFARLFVAPGMSHCRGGLALDEFDPLTAVVAWVEHGVAPQQLIATGRAFPARSRPICAYPAQARYQGSGSTEDASSFACRVVDVR